MLEVCCVESVVLGCGGGRMVATSEGPERQECVVGVTGGSVRMESRVSVWGGGEVMVVCGGCMEMMVVCGGRLWRQCVVEVDWWHYVVGEGDWWKYTYGGKRVVSVCGGGRKVMTVW